MAGKSTVSRALHDIGLSAWFGGSLMGATGLNGAASHAKDPKERADLSADGWAIWAPVQAAAIGMHTIGALGLVRANMSRIRSTDEARNLSIVKTIVTAAAAGVTAYSGFLGQKVKKLSHEGAEGATEPGPSSSPELTSALEQLKIMQWAIPALTGAIVIMTSEAGEQQRGLSSLLDR